MLRQDGSSQFKSLFTVWFAWVPEKCFIKLCNSFLWQNFYQNSWLPGPLAPILFYIRINTSAVKISPVFKKSWYLIHKVDYVKADIATIIVICVNNCCSIFTKCCIVDLCQGSEYAKVLNIPGFWNAFGSKYARVLNIPWLHRVLNISGCLNKSWICLIMPYYVRICLILPEHVNMPKSTWMAFVLHVPTVIPCLLEYEFTCFNEVYSLKEQEAVFLKIQNLTKYLY